MHQEYRQKWESLGYDPKMGSAAVILPPPDNYKRLYYITSQEFGLNDIALKRLKVARFSDLNDPFELMSLNMRESPYRRVVTKFKDAYNSKTGLLCFSEDWTNPVLWSHYGERHKGICLGFDILKSNIHKVIYEDDRFLVDIPNNSKLTDIMNHPNIKDSLLTTKFVHWQYEQEWRMFVELQNLPTEGSLHFYPFCDGLKLSEIILGSQCEASIETIRELTSAIHTSVSVIKARLAHKFFKIVPDEKTVI